MNINNVSWVTRRVFGILFSSCDSVITIHNYWIPLKKILFGIHNLSEDWNLEFYVDPIANLRTTNSLFLNPNWIQIRTIFIWVPDLLPLLGPLIFLLFSLSPPDASLSLSLGYYRGQSPSIHNSSKKTSSKTHNKKNPKSKPIKLNQQ